MMVEIKTSRVGTRHNNAKYMRYINKSKDFGVISDVRHLRIGWFTWLLNVSVEYRGDGK